MNEEQNENQPEELEEKNELEILQEKADQYLEGWRRAKADYSNYKRDSEARQKEVIEFANARLIADLLPIYENLKMAVAHIPEGQEKEAWVQGFAHIARQFQDFLKNLSIEEIKTVGEEFNPEFHEAVAAEEKEGFEADTIFEELQTGYLLHGKVVTPAKLKVAK